MHKIKFVPHCKHNLSPFQRTIGQNNTSIKMNYLYISRPDRAVNTLRLGYKNQSVNAV